MTKAVEQMAGKVRDFFGNHRQDLPIPVVEHVGTSIDAGHSDELLVVLFAEAVYANRGNAATTPETMRLASQCADTIAAEDINPHVYKRGEVMADVLRIAAGGDAPKARRMAHAGTEPPVNESFLPRTPPAMIMEAENGRDTSKDRPIAKRRRSPKRR